MWITLSSTARAFVNGFNLSILILKSMDINLLQKSASQEIASAVDAKTLDAVRVKYVGRQDGLLTKILRGLKDLSLEERRKIGPQANAARQEIETLLEKRLKEFSARGGSAVGGQVPIDITRPGERIKIGHLHPLDILESEVRKIFAELNFAVISGPEIESEYYNFDALNIPPDHPARDMWDTLWIKSKINPPAGGQKSKLLLRTHTSPVQIRYMETHKPPFQIIVPGRVFRHEATDASHEINFYQIEGLMVGKDVTLANFKYIIEHFLRRLFGPGIKFRFRPSYFPFVEPGVEVDIKLEAKSSKLKADWLEVMGAGMVHPRVFEYAHYNPRDWQGFAFGMGLDRLAMIKYKIPDIRLFYSGDLRFIRQF